MARPFFEALRACGPDVTELLDDGGPVACVGDAAFGCIRAFKAHAAAGFYNGADLPDPAGLLEGSGKRMRHVKLKAGVPLEEAALKSLIAASYRDILQKLGAG